MVPTNITFSAETHLTCPWICLFFGVGGRGQKDLFYSWELQTHVHLFVPGLWNVARRQNDFEKKKRWFCNSRAPVPNPELLLMMG